MPTRRHHARTLAAALGRPFGASRYDTSRLTRMLDKSGLELPDDAASVGPWAVGKAYGPLGVWGTPVVVAIVQDELVWQIRGRPVGHAPLEDISVVCDGGRVHVNPMPFGLGTPLNLRLHGSPGAKLHTYLCGQWSMAARQERDRVEWLAKAEREEAMWAEAEREEATWLAEIESSWADEVTTESTAGSEPQRKTTKPGGTERDRVNQLWELVGAGRSPDQNERGLLNELANSLTMHLHHASAVLQARIEWRRRRGWPIEGGDGLASVGDRSIAAVYQDEDRDDEATTGYDTIGSDPGDSTSMRVTTARDRAEAGSASWEVPISRHSGYLSDLEEVEWHDTEPYPTIIIRGDGGLAVKLTNFAPPAGEFFYETLVSELERHWDTGIEDTGIEANDALAEHRAVIEGATEQRGYPPQALIRSAADAEEAAAAWMRWLGMVDAAATPVGPDEGVDVLSDDAVAQVKAQMVATGRPDVQRLFGAATRAKKRALFFSLSGYTAGAVEFADATEVALFAFDLQGQAEPVNDPAVQLIREFADAG